MTKQNAASSYPRGCTDNGLLMQGMSLLSDGAFKVYSVLLVRSQSARQPTWPSVETLSVEALQPERTISRHLGEIQRAGLMRAERRVGTSSVYYLAPSVGQPPPAPLADLKPWKAEGVSRTTYYRRRKAKTKPAKVGLVTPPVAGRVPPNVGLETPPVAGRETPPVAAHNGKNQRGRTKGGGGAIQRDEEAPAAIEPTAGVSSSRVPVQEVAEYLRQATGHPWSAAEVEPYMRRTIQRGSVDDHVRIIAWAVAVWGKRPELLPNVRPKTLFGPKFEEYAEKAREWARQERFETPGEKRSREEHNEIKRAEREATAVVPAVDLEPKTVASESPKRPEPAARTPRPMRRAPRQETPEEERDRIERKRGVLEAQAEKLKQREANRDEPPAALDEYEPDLWGFTEDFQQQLLLAVKVIVDRFGTIPPAARAEADRRLSAMLGAPAYWTFGETDGGQTTLAAVARVGVETNTGKPIDVQYSTGAVTPAFMLDVDGVNAVYEGKGGKHPLMPLVSALAPAA